jgi:hypothetical protein
MTLNGITKRKISILLMKRIMLFVLLLTFSQKGIAQNKLAMLYSSAGIEYGKANAIDADNNYINGALFQNTINVNPVGTTNLTSSGLATEIALTKYNANGLLVWAKRIGGANTSEAPHGIDCDAAKNIYVTGYFGSTTITGSVACSFNPNGGNTVMSEGNEDCFVAKYDENGNHIWSFGLGNAAQNTQERAWDIAVDAAGNSYIGGGFQGTMNFNPLGIAMNISLTDGLVGLFIAKYNTNGICQWVIPINAQCNSVFNEGYITFDLDASGNLLASGNFRGTNVNLNPNGTGTTLSSNGNCDIFIAKYNTSNGTLNWVKQIGSTAQDLVSPGALRCDNNGNPYFTGRLSGTNTVDFDPSAGVTIVANSALYIASFDTNGSLRYAKGMNSGTGDGGHRISFDSNNNVYIAGWMNGTATFGTISRTANSTTADVFLAKYNNDLSTCNWAFNFGGTGSTDNSICAGLVVDMQDNPIITGQLYGTNADVDPSSDALNFSSIGNNDCFVIKYTANGLLWISSPLPVNLLSFSANAIGKEVVLHWNTAQEINFSHFEVERSINGKDFSTIGNINASATNSYQFTHINGANNFSIIYYRLKMVDKDGKFSYSGIVTIKSGKEKVSVLVYPNPVTDVITIQSNSLYSKVYISDINGKVVITTNHVHELNIAHLTSGFYILQLIDNNGLVLGIQKIIKH